MSLIETGELDLVYNPLVSQLDFFREDPAYRVESLIRPGVPRVVVLNTEVFPFDDVTTRQAVAWAIDRQRILDEVFGNIGAVPTGIITPGLLGFWAEGADQWPGYDLEQAAAMLAEAGWADTDGDGILDKDGQAFRITYGQIPGFPFDQYGQIIQSDLASLGIELTIENEEQAAYLADLRAGKWQMAGMLFPATDPDVLFVIASSTSIDTAWNTARFSNPEVDALLAQGRVTLDQTARAAIYQQIQQLLLADMPYIPMYQIVEPFIVKSEYKDVKTDAQGFYDFYDTYVAAS